MSSSSNETAPKGGLDPNTAVDGSPPAKRAHLTSSASTEQHAVPTTSDSYAPTQAALDDLREWCRAVNIELSESVKITTDNVIHGMGMVAVKAVSEGDVLFTIPRSALFSHHTCAQRQDISAFFDAAQKELVGHQSNAVHASDHDHHHHDHDEVEGQQPGSDSGWSPLLIALMLESDDAESRWGPYFRSLPPALVQPATADRASPTPAQPVFWSDEHQRLLPDAVRQRVVNDKQAMEREYHLYVQPFIKAHAELCKGKDMSLDRFMRLACLVMAYSFTDDVNDTVCMCPIADVLNHRTGYNNARLFYSEDSLQMIATQDIPAGHEVFNTYGELNNGELLQKHGFVEPTSTPFEEASVPLKDIVEECQQVSQSLDRKSAIERLDSMLDRHFMSGVDVQAFEDFAIDIGRGMLVGPNQLPRRDVKLINGHFLAIIKVLLMDQSTFERFDRSDIMAEESDEESEEGGECDQGADAAADCAENIVPNAFGIKVSRQCLQVVRGVMNKLSRSVDQMLQQLSSQPTHTNIEACKRLRKDSQSVAQEWKAWCDKIEPVLQS